MITNESFVPMAYFKRDGFTGSMKGMRYLVKKQEDQFLAVVYPEPFCYEVTPEEKKIRAVFEFTMEGRIQVIEWLNQQYEVNQQIWEKGGAGNK